MLWDHSPAFSQECIEFNAAKTWRFLVTSEELAKGADGIDI